MKEYMFDLGNSNTGPVGACVYVKADTPEDALRKLGQTLGKLNDGVEAYANGSVEVRVFVNAQHVSLADLYDAAD